MMRPSKILKMRPSMILNHSRVGFSTIGCKGMVVSIRKDREVKHIGKVDKEKSIGGLIEILIAFFGVQPNGRLGIYQTTKFAANKIS